MKAPTPYNHRYMPSTTTNAGSVALSLHEHLLINSSGLITVPEQDPVPLGGGYLLALHGGDQDKEARLPLPASDSGTQLEVVLLNKRNEVLLSQSVDI